LNILAKVARYTEALLRKLSVLAVDTITPADLHELFIIALAEIRFLQDEYAVLQVQSQFDKDTTKLFRSFRSNTSGLSEEAIEDLRKAAAITAHKPAPTSSDRPRGRGRGRPTHHRPNNAYQNFGSRSVPPFPPRRGGPPGPSNHPISPSQE
jgi:hypothetical protein